MNKVFLVGLAMVLAMSMVPVGCTEPLNGDGDDNGDGLPPPVAEEIELDFATFWPAGDFQAAIGHVNWVRTLEGRVAAETPHALTIRMRSGISPWDIWLAIQAGEVDIGATGPGFIPAEFPLFEAVNLPADLQRTNAYAMSMTVQALYDEFIPLQEELTVQNLKLMHFWSTGPAYFFMTGGNEVRTLADFAGKTIRVPSFSSMLCIEALGAEPLVSPWDMALERFEAGLLEGALCPADTPKGFGLAAYVRNATFAPFSYQFVFTTIMNRDKWNSLPAEVKTIFDEVNAVWPEYYGKLRAWGEADGLQYCYRTIPGFTYYDLRAEDPEEYQKWVDATAHLIEDWIGGDATRQALWDKFVEVDEYYATTAPWSTWTPGDSPPPVPTFP